jgi:hypothetical protein
MMHDIPGILALSIPIVAIVTGGAVVIARMVIKHRERMGLIEMGLHPDYPPLDDGADGGGERTTANAPSVAATERTLQ